MKIAVLMLYCSPEGRSTTFTRDWADRAMKRVAAYFLAQSGGREVITHKVFDWLNLEITAKQWSDLGMGAYTSLQSWIEDKIGEKLSGYDHIMIAIDHPTSSGGTTPGTFTYLAATNFTPSLICHELGHRYGADDAYRDTPEGPRIYHDNFCVMGAEGWPYTFADETLTDQNMTGLNQNGPNMGIPGLLSTGWLKESEHGVAVDVSSHPLSTGGRTEELSALAGAPGPNWSKPPVMLRYQDWLLEYRVAATDSWDRGVADPGQGAGGWLVLRRSVPGAPPSVFMKAIAAIPGASMHLGTDNVLDIFKPGPPLVSVLSFNAANRTIRLHLSQRAAMQPPGGTTYGGVDAGGGGWVWTPGRGFKKVPPHSPLINVLDQLARVQGLQQLLAVAAREDRPALSKKAANGLRTLQRQVEELRVEPSLSPLAKALESVADLQDASERLQSTGMNEETQRFVEASRQRLSEVKRILAVAAKAEHNQ